MEALAKEFSILLMPVPVNHQSKEEN